MESSAIEDETTPAIKALGSLFNLTEIYLSDEFRRFSPSTEATSIVREDAVAVDSNIDLEPELLPEDMELVKLMSGMGLPMSFQTKQRKGTLGGKRKHKKDKLHASDSIQDDVREPIEEMVGVYESSEILQQTSKSLSCSLIGRESELSNFDTAASVDDACHLPAGVKDSTSSTSSSANSTIDECIPSDLGQDQDLNSKSECHEVLLKEDIVVLEDSSLGNIVSGECDQKDQKGEEMESICVESNLAVNHDAGSVFGDWKVYWDNFYSRNYFHNLVTQECTWDPPPGMEALVFTNITDKPIKLENDIANLDVTIAGCEESADQAVSYHPQSTVDVSEEYKGDDLLSDQPLHDSVGGELANDTSSHIKSTKRKKKSRRVKSKQKLSTGSGEFQLPSVIEGFYPGLSKYWCQRYSLFSKYDEGIQMDEEGWFSVTPESLARHHAHRCGSGTIVDLFAGVGGNTIQFAQRCRHLIAIDIDPKKIDYAQHNAAIYGVGDRIDFIRGDSLILAPTLKVDVVYMSPPWGGPDYAKVKTFDIKTMLKPHDGYFLFNIGKGIASKVVMFLPRNVDINQLAELALSTNPPWSLEVEKNFLNGKLKGITAYFVKPSS